MHEAHKILVRIPEAHSAADSALEERSRTRHVEGDHTLVLVPYVHHPVHLLVRSRNAETSEQVVPVGAEFGECLVSFLYSIETGNEFLCPGPVEKAAFDEFLLLRIFHITKDENQARALARSEGDGLAVRSNRAPSMCHRVV